MNLGEVVVTYGKGKLWPPKYIPLSLLYAGIRENQKKRWNKMSLHQPDWGVPDPPEYQGTHVMIPLMKDGELQLFEATYPKAQWRTLEDANLKVKPHRFFKYVGANSEHLDFTAMTAKADSLIGTPYDFGEIANFAISGWMLGLAEFVFPFVKDKNKSYVCSTIAAIIMAAGGAKFRLELNAIDPAYFENVRVDWKDVSI